MYQDPDLTVSNFPPSLLLLQLLCLRQEAVFNHDNSLMQQDCKWLTSSKLGTVNAKIWCGFGTGESQQDFTDLEC